MLNGKPIVSENSINFVKNNKEDVSNRSSQEELRSGNEIHSRIEDTANRLESRVREAEEKRNGSKLSKREVSDLEKRIALDYAKENGLWIDDIYSLGSTPMSGGNENTLALDEKTGTLYKSDSSFSCESGIEIKIYSD